MTKAKAIRTFVRVYSLLKRERLRANNKLALHKTLIRSVMTFACPAWEFAADAPPFEIVALAKQGRPHHW
jgi:hypothetical protein